MRGFPRSVTMRGRPRSLRAQLASESCALVTSRVFIILKDFIAHLPPADADLLALLDAHRAYNNGGRSLFDDVIVHPEIADTELPGGQRVWAHWLAIPGLHGGLKTLTPDVRVPSAESDQGSRHRDAAALASEKGRAAGMGKEGRTVPRKEQP